MYMFVYIMYINKWLDQEQSLQFLQPINQIDVFETVLNVKTDVNLSIIHNIICILRSSNLVKSRLRVNETLVEKKIIYI